MPPSKVADYLALVGDKSDNLPGVSGIGENTAHELLRSHDSAFEAFIDPDIKADPRFSHLVSDDNLHSLSTMLQITTLNKNLAVPRIEPIVPRPDLVHTALCELGVVQLANRLHDVFPEFNWSLADNSQETKQFVHEQILHTKPKEVEKNETWTNIISR